MNHETANDSPRPWDASLELNAIVSDEWDTDRNRPQAEAISVASVWQMDSPESADAALAGKTTALVYRRDGHPNERSLAKKLAKLHGAKFGVVTAQGMSAIASVALGLLKPGDQVWVADELYGKTSKLFSQNLAKWHVITRTFDPTNPQHLTELSTSTTALVLVETMSNPRLKIPDIKAVNQAARQAGAVLVVDNTFATHLICRPLELGAEVVIESLSKQVNGHSDSMLGLVASSNENLINNVRDTITTFGMASSPLDCFLTQRGLFSLAVRVERACQNALALAQVLNKHPQVAAVDYPGLADHPQHALANSQLRGGYGWMLSFHLAVDRSGVLKLMESLRPEIQFVPSLGDVATTLSHPASTSHRGLSGSQRQELGIQEGTLRISCGIEPTTWLLDRFSAALAII